MCLFELVCASGILVYYNGVGFYVVCEVGGSGSGLVLERRDGQPGADPEWGPCAW